MLACSVCLLDQAPSHPDSLGLVQSSFDFVGSHNYDQSNLFFRARQERHRR